jgi:hypothetical protein
VHYDAEKIVVKHFSIITISKSNGLQITLKILITWTRNNRAMAAATTTNSACPVEIIS